MDGTTTRVTRQIMSIRAKIDRLKLRSNVAPIGATTRPLGACLSEDQIVDFEITLGCRLPEDYRRFLLEIGNGGLGPGLGLTPFGSESLIDPRIPVGALDKLNPSAPFVYREDWNLPALKTALEEQSKNLDELQTYYFATERIDGSIRIADLGCGAIALLVLNGPQRGRIWLDFRGTFGGITPAAPADSAAGTLSFLEWYEAWLDDESS